MTKFAGWNIISDVDFGHKITYVYCLRIKTIFDLRLLLERMIEVDGFYIEKYKINQKIEKEKLTVVDFSPGKPEAMK